MEYKEEKLMGIPKVELLASGHRGCAGCGELLAARYALKASGPNVIVVNATGCLEVTTSPYPQTAWRVPWIHGAFENAASIASGVVRALKQEGKDTKVLVLGGDGGTFDIGFGALSGAAERGEDFCYVCFDNGAYMNTGIQRSGATPQYAHTTTSPAGKKIHGKQEFKKPLPFIMAAHGCYVATSVVSDSMDFIAKVKKGLDFKGPAYIQVFCPCTPGWGIADDMAIDVSQLAFQTCVYPMYEIENGLLKISKKPRVKKEVDGYFKVQKRFKHLSEEEIKDAQKHIDENWEKLLKLEEAQIKF